MTITNYIPVVLENEGPSERSYDLLSRMMKDRIIFLNGGVDDHSAHIICMQLLYLNSVDPKADIDLYLNSPGGVVTSGYAILDTLAFISNDVRVICMGQACSMGAMILSAGTKGKRFCLPNSRVMFHQPSSGGISGMASDIEIQAKEILKMKATLNQMVVNNTGQALEVVERIMDRDTFMSAQEALDFGAVDHIISHQSQVSS